MPLPPITRAQQIGQALGGFGAGLQGNLPQFQQAQAQQQQMQMLQQEKEQEMQLARQQALFVDAQAGLQFLEAGNYDEIVELGMNRLQNLQQLGAEDPSDTQRLTQLAIAARNGSEEARELLRNELTSTVNIGRATGMLEAPERQNAATAMGELQQDYRAGLITEEQYNFGIASEMAGEEMKGDFDNPSYQAALKVKASGRDVEEGMFDLGEEGFNYINNLTQEQANQELTMGNPRSENAPDQRQQKINALAGMYGDAVSNPIELATKLVDGIIETEFLEDGTVMMTDNSLLQTDPDKAVTYLPVSDLNSDALRAVPREGQTLYELAQTVGGISGGVKQVLSNVAGQFGFSAFSDEMEAYQTLNTAMGDMTRSLMVGDRWTVGQANMLREELNIKASIGSPGVQTNNRMRSIDGSLKLRLEQFERDMNDNTLDRQDRSMQRSNAATIRNFIDLMGVPEKINVSDLTMDFLEEVDGASARSIIRDMTEDEYNTLSEQVRDNLMELARGR